ncbi:cytochrome p450 [Colletotrichum chrysophilum]|uniref:Cytochrome p450 n=1 Tax=Colletotrichum chrysophilum TaxID=1836956 RepID=A0AAD9ARZ4_9PEZI|nr:cytochrome p450 [Colletotrichum chrysophilum]
MGAVYRRRLNHDIKALHEKYGPVVRLSPTELSFATIAAQIAIHRPGGSAKEYAFFTKEGTLEAMMGDIIWPATNLLTVTDPQEHQRLRKALQPAFTSSALRSQESIQKAHAYVMISNIRKSAAKRSCIDLTPLMSQAIWDIISDLSFGEPLLKDQLVKFETLKTTFCAVSPLLEALQVLLAVPGAQAFVNACVSLVPLLFWLPTRVLPSAQLRKRLDRQDENEDFLTAIMRCRELGISMTDKELQSNASLLVMVGYDTTATSLSATMNLLLRNPHYLEALKKELQSHFTSFDEMTAASLSQLPLLNGCIQEALRLFPPANGKGTNRTSPGTFIDGIYVPKGVNVSADMYTIQRSPHYWSRPDSFCPERWFDNGPGTEFANDIRSSHCPFLLGPRMCIGRAVALQSMRFIIAGMVCDLDLEAVGQYDWDSDVSNSYLWTDYRCFAEVRQLL